MPVLKKPRCAINAPAQRSLRASLSDTGNLVNGATRRLWSISIRRMREAWRGSDLPTSGMRKACQIWRIKKYGRRIMGEVAEKPRPAAGRAPATVRLQA